MTIYYYLYGYLPYRYFYFKKSLRTSAAATALRIMWALMVLSTTTFGMSRIPTGSSPVFVDYDNSSVYYVIHDGDVDIESWNIDISYGNYCYSLRTSTISIIVHIMLKWMVLYLVIGM